jgi:hypothetical protein
MYVHTDADAPRGRLLVGDPEDPDPDRWRELVAQDPEAVWRTSRSSTPTTVGPAVLLDPPCGE